MKEKIDEEVSVSMVYSAKHKLFQPRVLQWKNQRYELAQVDYYHSYMEGRERQHIFELVDIQSILWFRLRFDSSNLHWTLEAIHDGLTD